MSILDIVIEAMRYDVGLQIALCGFLILVVPITNIIRNLYYHPLSKFPGPKLWAVSRLPFLYALLNATLVKQTQKFHEIYGDIVRIAPDEVSFASEEAWNDIYAHRRGHKRAPRDKTLFVAPGQTTDNIVTTSDSKFHSRARALLSNSFTENALHATYPLIHGHCDLLMRRFGELVLQNPSQVAVIDMTDWITFFTMDVIGDLALGESFGCLERGEYHDWVRLLFQYVKMITVAAAPRYYSTRITDFMFQRLMPRSVLEGQKAHKRYADERINRRLDSKTDSNRPDFMTPFMKNNTNYQTMSREEILSTFTFLIIGGSETTATTLTGIFNHLIRRPEVLARLTREIRTYFEAEEDIVLEGLADEKLPYLEATINEGLRMCNPIPTGLPRQVPDGGDTYLGVFLPGGTRLRVQSYTVCRSAKYFYQPDIFHPERWLSKANGRPDEFDNDRLSASKPFSTGYSACLGRPMAMDQMRLAISRLLWKFDISEDPNERVDFDDWPMPSFIEKGPMRVRVKMRDGC